MEDIKTKFLVEATEHGNAIAVGDYKKANKIHKKLNVLYSKIKEDNQLGVFADLLNENNENVKLWAAIFSLKSSPDIAEKVLEKLTELSSITGLTAKTTLQLWKEGKLDL